MKKLINFYATNPYFHSFVTTVEFAVVGFAVGYSGGFPSGKSGWAALATGLGGAVWGGIRGWLQSKVLAQPTLVK